MGHSFDQLLGLSKTPNNRFLLQQNGAPLEPTRTHSRVVDLKWLDESDQRLLAWTEAIGQEVGGLWYSDNGGTSWVERTPSLAICPPEYPYLCARLQVCYKDAASAHNCVGPPDTWCGLPELGVKDQIGKYGTWCSNGCPNNYPYLCPSLGVCYKYEADARKSPCNGLPGTWCGLPDTVVRDQIPLYGSFCGNNVTVGSREPVEVLTIFTDDPKSNNVVVLGSGTHIWTSSDYGQTFNASQTTIDRPRWRGIDIKSLKIHPWHSDWLLLLVKRPNCQNQRQQMTECPHDLLLTKDLFNKERTWSNLTQLSNGKIAGFVDFDWGAALCTGKECNSAWRVSDDTIFATMYRKAGDYDESWDKDVHFVVSSNLFQDFNVKATCGNMFEVIGSSVYLAYANSCPTDIHGNSRSGDKSFKGINLYTSTDGANTFIQACLPVALKQEGYELMAAHDNLGVIVIADYLASSGWTDVPASSIFTAGPHHALFSLSMPYAYRADFGLQTDFARIEALPGVFIANQRQPIDGGADYYDMDMGTLVETRITFNGGGTWSSIPAPKTYNWPKCNRCLYGKTQGCFLHLRGMSTYESQISAMPAVYSNPAAPGFIMATGVTASLGYGLLDEPEGICTWLSTDGGVTWRDVAEGSFIYEFADWGGVIVMAKSGQNVPTDEVRYSVDFGASWSSVALSTSLLVDNIRIDPDAQRAWVVVHGRACEVDGRSADPGVRAKCSLNSTAMKVGVPGLMYTLDIAKLRPDMTQCPTSAYETFSVPAGAGDATPACTLGKVMKIRRRKPEKTCFNGGDFVRGPAQNTTCNCTAADVECDYGFMRDGRAGNKCAQIQRDLMGQCPAVQAGLYTVSETGLRMVHGDVCLGIDAVIADTDGQGGRTGGGGGGGGGGGKRRGLSGVAKFFISVLVIGAVAGTFVAWWIFAATEQQRDFIRSAGETGVSVVVNLFHSVRDRLRGRPTDLHEQDMGYFQPLSEIDKDREAGMFTLR